MAENNGVAAPALSSAAKHLILTHAWPENVRELKRALQRACSQIGGAQRLDATDLAPYLNQPASSGRTSMSSTRAGETDTVQCTSRMSPSRPAEAQRTGGSTVTSDATDGAGRPQTLPAAAAPERDSQGGTFVRAYPGGVVIELPNDGIDFEEIEKAILLCALEKTHGNVVRAARLLRMGRGSLRYRLEKFDLAEPKRRGPRQSMPPRAESGEGLRRAS